MGDFAAPGLARPLHKARTEHPMKLDVLFWDEISSLEEKNRKIEAVDSNWNNMAH
jgi:hypothetical protein